MNSEQLEIDLWGELDSPVRDPWGGRSPRELTRGFEMFSFVRSGTGRVHLEAPGCRDQGPTKEVHHGS